MTQWIETPEAFGEAVLTLHADGTVTVERADPVIGVAPDVLAQLEAPRLEADGTLVLDTAGAYRYQRVGERTEQGATWLVYRRKT